MMFGWSKLFKMSISRCAQQPHGGNGHATPSLLPHALAASASSVLMDLRGSEAQGGYYLR